MKYKILKGMGFMQLKVVSFNIRCADDANGHSIPERAPRLNQVISPIKPDLIGLQEWRPAWEEHIIKHFGKDYEIFNKLRSDEDKESGPILWQKDKFECIKTGYFWLSDTPEVESRGWDELYNCYRICSYAILKDIQSGKAFTFMNTHFGFGDKGQCDSAELIYEYSKKISAFPTLITGDFNMTPDSMAYKKMTEFFTDVNAVTAKDMRTTFHNYNPEKFNTIETTQHIDYCFISTDIKPIDQRIIDETVDGKFPSDHYGLEITIEI